MKQGLGLGLHKGKFLKPFEISDLGGLSLWGTFDDTSTLNAKMCARYTNSNLEFLSTASTDFDKGDEDFSYGGWFYYTGSSGTFVSKYDNAPNRSFLLLVTSGVARAYISSDGTAITTVDSAALSSSTWHFIVVAYDSAADLLKISLNGATYVTVSHSGGAYSSTTANFEFGTWSGNTYLTGRTDNCFFYDKALTQAQVTTLYNGGSGTAYENADTVSLVSWWSMNEKSGNRSDEHGSNTLTDNNTVTFEIGRVNDNAENNEYIWRIVDQSTNGYLIDQGTAADQGQLTNTKEIVFDGSTDYYDITQVLTGGVDVSTQGTWAFWVKPVAATPVSGNYICAVSDTEASTICSLYQWTDGKSVGVFRNGGTIFWRLETDAIPFTDGVWTHVALVHNGSTPILYVDGSPVATTFTTSTDKTKWINNLTTPNFMSIGAYDFNTGGLTGHLDGSLGEPIITTSAATAEDITNIYNDKLSVYS